MQYFHFASKLNISEFFLPVRPTEVETLKSFVFCRHRGKTLLVVVMHGKTYLRNYTRTQNFMHLKLLRHYQKFHSFLSK